MFGTALGDAGGETPNATCREVRSGPIGHIQAVLVAAGYGEITTEIRFPAPPFYYAEDEHQRYLAKNPGGYCGLGGTGVSCPIGVVA